ncbi:MAG: hypothetical protein KAU41_03625 [Deltaproteobacteria bacterium]|nr:hypothetical protein [Deltaproteobacteria bacterium]
MPRVDSLEAPTSAAILADRRIDPLFEGISLLTAKTVIEDTYLGLDDTWFRKYIDPMSGGSVINWYLNETPWFRAFPTPL